MKNFMTQAGLCKVIRRYGLCLGLLFTLPSAIAEPGETTWQYGANVYLWVADLNIETVQNQDVTVDFNDIVKNLEMAFMGTLNARKDRWSAMADTIYMKIGAKEDITAGLIGSGLVSARADLEQDTLVFTGMGGYEIYESETTTLDLNLGIRHLSVETDLGLDFPAGISRQLSDNASVTDAVMGVSGATTLNDRWSLMYRADVGGGDSDLAWQALMGANYQFSKVQAAFGYRILHWDLDGSDLLNEYEISGPYIGVRFMFN